MPVEPPPSAWAFTPIVHSLPGDLESDIVGLGADLDPGTLLAAYRAGLFPMPLDATRGTPGKGELAWWSPDPRGILPLDGLHVSRSLRMARRHFELRVDTAFETVIEACAHAPRPGGWITDDIRAAYLRLHGLGWAHSVEAWTPTGDELSAQLAGGLYGVAIGGLFAGESMFHRVADASKVALVGLVELLRAGGASLLDIQWVTPHLRRLGAVEVPRERYLELLAGALRRPLPKVFGGP